MIGRQPLADEMVEARSGDLAVAQRLDERVGVVQLGPWAMYSSLAVAALAMNLTYHHI